MQIAAGISVWNVRGLFAVVFWPSASTILTVFPKPPSKPMLSNSPQVLTFVSLIYVGIPSLAETVEFLTCCSLH